MKITGVIATVAVALLTGCSKEGTTVVDVSKDQINLANKYCLVKDVTDANKPQAYEVTIAQTILDQASAFQKQAKATAEKAKADANGDAGKTAKAEGEIKAADAALKNLTDAKTQCNTDNFAKLEYKATRN